MQWTPYRLPGICKRLFRKLLVIYSNVTIYVHDAQLVVRRRFSSLNVSFLRNERVFSNVFAQRSEESIIFQYKPIVLRTTFADASSLRNSDKARLHLPCKRVSDDDVN